MSYLRYPAATAWLNERGIPWAEATLRRKASRCEVPFTKVGKAVLFDPDRLTQWLEEKAVEPKA